MTKMEWVTKEFEKLDWTDPDLIEERVNIEAVFNAAIASGYDEISPFGKGMLDRLLKGLPLSKIKEEDEWEKRDEIEGGWCWSAVRYENLLKIKVKGEDGHYSYTDLGRCKIINVNPKMKESTVISGKDCNLCVAWLDLKVPITLPYIPPTIPWTFYVDVPKDQRKIHLIYLKNPALQIIKIDEYYSDMNVGTDMKQLTKKEWEAL